MSGREAGPLIRPAPARLCVYKREEVPSSDTYGITYSINPDCRYTRTAEQRNSRSA